VATLGDLCTVGIMIINDDELDVRMFCAESGTLSKTLLDCRFCSDLGTKHVTIIDYESAHSCHETL